MFHLKILLPAEHNLHPSPLVTLSYHPFLQELILPFHARYVPHLESVRLVFISYFVPLGMGQESTLCSPKGWGQSRNPHESWMSNPHPTGRELQVHSPSQRATQWASYQEHSPLSDSFSSQFPWEADS